jgi:two-component system, chemotaxis family, sensor kinase Cph1
VALPGKNGGPPASASASASAGSDRSVDLAGCDQEPIHLLGGVQPVGVLLAVSEPDMVVRIASANSATLLGRPPADLLGRPLADVLGTAGLEWVDPAPRGARTATPTPLRMVPSAADGPAQLVMSVHRADGMVVIEVEPDAGAAGAGVPTIPLRQAMNRMQEAVGIPAVCAALARAVREVSGYDRVMLYRFAADGSGEVVAEERRADWESYLGLHYPDSDIPPQARRLYETNWIRAISSVDYEPVGLIAGDGVALGRPLDLSGSALRSVSPVHLQYLRNMGVGASMSISLLREGRLWGLVACHHGTPRWPSAQTRAMCELLGIAASMRLAGVEESGEAAYRERMTRLRVELATRLATGADLVAALVAGEPGVMDLVRCDGVSVRFGDRRATSGRVPEPEQIDRIAAALPPAGTAPVFDTDHLGGLDPALAEISAVASGVLAVRADPGAPDHIMWFRSERLRSVDWAGDPRKPAGVEGRLTPRGSFALWRETVQEHALPWLPEERDAALQLWRAVSEVRRTAEIVGLNAKLNSNNSELEAFAYIASHDLREPLRGIANYTTFVLEDAGGSLDPKTLSRLETVRRLTVRMDLLLESLLHFSLLGRAALTRTPVELGEVLDEVVEVLGPQLALTGCELRRGPLPRVSGDRVQLSELLLNLVSNAIKYSAEEGQWVEVGASLVTPPGGAAPEPGVYVRDNGIGIEPELQEGIFGIFRRLHLQDEYGGGAGVGLTISRRIAERHGGQLWVESTPAAGSTFWLTIPDAGADGTAVPANRRDDRELRGQARTSGRAPSGSTPGTS